MLIDAVRAFLNELVLETFFRKKKKKKEQLIFLTTFYNFYKSNIKFFFLNGFLTNTLRTFVNKTLIRKYLPSLSLILLQQEI